VAELEFPKNIFSFRRGRTAEAFHEKCRALLTAARNNATMILRRRAMKRGADTEERKCA
jgi:hypothetical protein